MHEPLILKSEQESSAFRLAAGVSENFYEIQNSSQRCLLKYRFGITR